MDKLIDRIFIPLSLFLIILRLIFISNTVLINDEAYYAIYARHLAWGYVDHGPVVAYLIKFFTLFWENSFTVRLGATTLMTIITVILYFFGKVYFNRQVGILLSLSMTANMLFHTNAIVITPDVPMIFFTILAIMYYYLAYCVDKKYIYIGGIMLGLAVLSKISALFPALGIALYPLLIKNKRHWFKNIHFYGSFVIALLIFLPFIIWNLQNDLAFVRNQGSHIYRGGGIPEFLKLWLGLAIVSGPLFFYFSVIRPFANLKEWKNISESVKYFTIVTIVPLFYFLGHSLFSKFELNWPAPAFISGLFLLGLQKNKSSFKLYYFQIIYSLTLIMIITVQTFKPILPIRGDADVTNRYYMYEGFTDSLKTYIDENPELQNVRIAANNFQIPSMINFYLNPSPEATCFSIGYQETLYLFLYPNYTLKGNDFIFIKHGMGEPEFLFDYFEEISELKKFKINRGDQNLSNFSLWYVKNYTGEK